MRKMYKFLLLLLFFIAIISIIVVLNINNGRYIRAQVFDCGDYDFYNISETELQKMPFIEKIIITGGNDVFISHEEYEEFLFFIEQKGALIKYKDSCYELQIRMP